MDRADTAIIPTTRSFKTASATAQATTEIATNSIVLYAAKPVAAYRLCATFYSFASALRSTLFIACATSRAAKVLPFGANRRPNNASEVFRTFFIACAANRAAKVLPFGANRGRNNASEVFRTLLVLNAALPAANSLIFGAIRGR